uniref:SMP-LTD domain-containing protein n=1 Tax=Knipowitschia caucasica TaxID=637954 RepID=A0AAV2LS05_KNICA
MDNQTPTARAIAAATTSCLTFLGYAFESFMLHRQTPDQRGYMGSKPGLLKTVQVWGGCQMIPLIVEAIHDMPSEIHGWQLCESQAGLNGTEDTRRHLTAMTGRAPSHAESTQSPTSKLPHVEVPKLQVLRPPSKESVTIHFSAQRKDEEEDDGEIYMTNTSATSAPQDDSNIMTGLEASEDMFEDALQDLTAGGTVIPETTGPKEVLCAGKSSNSSPSKSLSFPSSDKPFLSLVKSLSSDVESKDGSSSSSIRHRHLKNFVKSFSSDTSQDQPSSSTSRPLESRLNLQMFKQFTQSRLPISSLSSGSDSKTAPTSPMNSLENRSFFKVAEVEARIEDTKRRLSEVIAEPLQLLTKMMDEKSVSLAQSIPHYTLVFLTLLVYGYFILPLPTYVGGMLLGIGLGFLLAIGVVWLTGPKSSNGCRYVKLRKLDIKEPEIHKGWMNDISNYDPETYHATLTQSVYVRLEGSTIRLSKPNHNIPRRAAHNDTKPDVTFISQKIYDLTYSRVHLVPEGLARKRIWNKKYPICIELGRQDDFMSRTEDDNWESSEGSPTSDRAAIGSMYQNVTLHLFGRTGREKEEWFQRFLQASKHKVHLKKSASATVFKTGGGHSRSGSRSSLDEALLTQSRPKDSSTPTAGSAKVSPLLDYSVYMANLLPNQEALSSTSTCSSLQSPMSSPGADKKLPGSCPSPPEHAAGAEDNTLSWLNAALGRIFWDFLREPYWTDIVSKKIQMKLSKIRLPYFMNELTLRELDMGSSTPRILSGSKPYVDYKGLWFDLDVAYSGSFLMTLETKMNLIRLGKEEESLRFGEPGKEGPRTYCLADSDEESSSAGSSDEEDTSELSNDSAGADGLVGGHRPSKIMRFVDKIAKSKYFQKATETEFIKKKMEEVSNTPLLLTVELQEVRGRLVVNIPPPPTDRIWYGFRTPPRIELKARPKLGERVVTLAHVTDWIEKKLDQEFQKIFVMPNMDDIWLSVMHSVMDQRTAGAGPADDLATSDPGSDS